MERNRLLKKAIISFEEYERLVKDGVQKDILAKRIDKATSFIEEFNRIILSRKDISKEALELMTIPYNLLEILKGEDK